MFTKNYAILASFCAVGSATEYWMSSYHEGCFLPTSYSLQVYFFSMALYLLIYQCGVNRCCESVLLPVFVGGFVIMQAAIALAVFSFFINLVLRRHCAPGSVWAADLILLIISIFFAQPLIFLALKVYLWIALVVGRVMDTWDKIEFMLNWVVDPIVGKDKFHSALNSFKVSDMEAQLIRDKLGRRQENDQDHIPPENRTKCPLCLETFRRGDSVIDHPGCFDSFHSNCLIRYLTTETASCPLCGKGTRQEMGITLQQNMQRAIERRLLGEVEL